MNLNMHSVRTYECLCVCAEEWYRPEDGLQLLAHVLVLGIHDHVSLVNGEGAAHLVCSNRSAPNNRASDPDPGGDVSIKAPKILSWWWMPGISPTDLTHAKLVLLDGLW